jgi:ABC-type uncharacterized transport system substrate-binding protein
MRQRPPQKTFFITTSAILIYACLAGAQEIKIRRVGLFYDFETPTVQGLTTGLRELGYIEGKNLILERILRKTFEQLDNPSGTLKNKNFEVMVTIGRENTALLMKAIPEIPIVFAPATEPLQSGFVKSLSHPSTNLTGLSYEPDATVRGKELEIFTEVVPALRQVLLLYEPRAEDHANQTLTALRRAASHLKLTLNERAVKTIAEAVGAISLTKLVTDGVFTVCTHGLSGADTPAISKKNKLPFYGCPNQVILHGALVSYAPNMYELGRRGAWYVHRILQGARPADLPVELPNKFEFLINLKTAEAIGLKIPPEVLQRADRVFK